MKKLTYLILAAVPLATAGLCSGGSSGGGGGQAGKPCSSVEASDAQTVKFKEVELRADLEGVGVNERWELDQQHPCAFATTAGWMQKGIPLSTADMNEKYFSWKIWLDTFFGAWDWEHYTGDDAASLKVSYGGSCSGDMVISYQVHPGARDASEGWLEGNTLYKAPKFTDIITSGSLTIKSVKVGGVMQLVWKHDISSNEVANLREVATRGAAPVVNRLALHATIHTWPNPSSDPDPDPGSGSTPDPGSGSNPDPGSGSNPRPQQAANYGPPAKGYYREEEDYINALPGTRAVWDSLYRLQRSLYAKYRYSAYFDVRIWGKEWDKAHPCDNSDWWRTQQLYVPCRESVGNWSAEITPVEGAIPKSLSGKTVTLVRSQGNVPTPQLDRPVYVGGAFLEDMRWDKPVLYEVIDVK